MPGIGFAGVHFADGGTVSDTGVVHGPGAGRGFSVKLIDAVRAHRHWTRDKAHVPA
ncbi:hypothetical protein ACH35V_28160 [Actinomadura sp. 1N219]|uniref:hypothetical protein n=1 Tax=Actinomadura sp. 1N219 TaxID=3375152 RepID=UPI0037A79485